MKINNKFVLATLLAAPQSISSWSSSPRGRGRMPFPRGVDFIDSPMARVLMDDILPYGPMSPNRRHSRRSSPRYEVVDTDDTFRLAVDVPGVKMEDISVSLEENILTISGHRESASENSRFTSRFSQSFALDASVDVDKFSATLENGVLIVTAPKDLQRIEDNVRKIPISSGVPDEQSDVPISDSASTAAAAASTAAGTTSSGPATAAAEASNVNRKPDEEDGTYGTIDLDAGSKKDA